jgi:hypothetical protein
MPRPHRPPVRTAKAAEPMSALPKATTLSFRKSAKVVLCEYQVLGSLQ